MSCQQTCQTTCCNQGYNSNIECQILHAMGEPAAVELSETITVNNETGILANKIEHSQFCGPVALEDYPINKDSIVLIRWIETLHSSSNVNILSNVPRFVLKLFTIVEHH